MKNEESIDGSDKIKSKPEEEKESKINESNRKMDSTESINAEIMPEGYNQYDYSFKIILLGSNGVGKSCLTAKAIRNVFSSNIQPTIGFEFYTYCVKIENKTIKLQIWDTCGLETYKSLVANFYRNSSLAIIVYSIDNNESFVDLENWMRELKTHSNPDVKLILVGNKCDLDQRKIAKEEALKFKEENNFELFLETSAKTGVNSQELFLQAANILLKNYQKFNIQGSNNDSRINSKTKISQKDPNARIPGEKSFIINQEVDARERDRHDSSSKSGCSKC